jgi:type II secretory pathway pseudopilin PulG
MESTLIDEATQSASVRRRMFRAGPNRRALGARRAFTFVECLIIILVLIILATLVIPQFSRANQDSKENMLKDSLHFLRTQIAVFKAQHQDVPPGYPDGNPGVFPSADAFVAQMTHPTDLACRIIAPNAPAYSYGPYMKEFPANPINGMNSIEMIGNNLVMPKPDGKTGWIYMPQTQEIVANVVGKDAAGTPYCNY